MEKITLTTNNYNKFVIEFLKNYSNAVSNRQGQMGYHFNLLTEQCGYIVENSHTNILMRLLQYKNQYGYVFLKSFIEMAGFDILLGTDAIQFETEYVGKNKIGSTGRIDGLVFKKGEFAIIIENKINHAGNQDEQIARYIEKVIGDGIVTSEKIYVVFLTRDGVEKPDDVSIRIMHECNIISNGNNNEEEEIYGSRYFACTYSGHIYDWLNGIRDMVPSKDIVLNAGLIQYIDFLDNLLSHNNSMVMTACEEYYKAHVEYDSDKAERMRQMKAFYKYLNDYESKQKEEPDSISNGINMLKNVLYKKYEEEMSVFLSVTKDFFTSGINPLMKDYHLNHIFDFYYTTIRDESWPKGIEFGWYPISFKKWNSNDVIQLPFCFKCPHRYLDKITLPETFIQNGKYYTAKTDPIKGFLMKNDAEQEGFLKNVYESFAKPIIEEMRKKDIIQ